MHVALMFTLLVKICTPLSEVDWGLGMFFEYLGFDGTSKPVVEP